MKIKKLLDYIENNYRKIFLLFSTSMIGLFLLIWLVGTNEHTLSYMSYGKIHYYPIYDDDIFIGILFVYGVYLILFILCLLKLMKINKIFLIIDCFLLATIIILMVFLFSYLTSFVVGVFVGILIVLYILLGIIYIAFSIFLSTKVCTFKRASKILTSLKQLYDEGILTEEEYIEKRNKYSKFLYL